MSGLHFESRSKHNIQITSLAKDTLLNAPIIDSYVVFIPFPEDCLDGDIASTEAQARQAAQPRTRVNVTNATCRDDTRLRRDFITML